MQKIKMTKNAPEDCNKNCAKNHIRKYAENHTNISQRHQKLCKKLSQRCLINIRLSQTYWRAIEELDDHGN